MKVIRFLGKDKTSLCERSEFGNCSILKACYSILDYVSSLNATKSEINGINRIDINLFDFASFREAWVNAVVHNDWLTMIPPAVYIYDDRLEVISYGQIPYALSKDDFFNGRSVPVNESLFKILLLSGLGEQSGHGVPVITKAYSTKAFNFSSNSILVTLPFAFIPNSVNLRNLEFLSSTQLKENNRLVLQFLLNNPSATLVKCAQECHLSLGGVKKIVKELKDNRLLFRLGSKKDGHWSNSER